VQLRVVPNPTNCAFLAMPYDLPARLESYTFPDLERAWHRIEVARCVAPTTTHVVLSTRRWPKVACSAGNPSRASHPQPENVSG
jgi:hypothetical protein